MLRRVGPGVHAGTQKACEVKAGGWVRRKGELSWGKLSLCPHILILKNELPGVPLASLRNLAVWCWVRGRLGPLWTEGTGKSNRNLTVAGPHTRSRGRGRQMTSSRASHHQRPSVNQKAEKVCVYPMDFWSKPKGKEPVKEVRNPFSPSFPPQPGNGQCHPCIWQKCKQFWIGSIHVIQDQLLLYIYFSILLLWKYMYISSWKIELF